MPWLRAGPLGFLLFSRGVYAFFIGPSPGNFRRDCFILQDCTIDQTSHLKPMAKIIDVMPELQGDEMLYVQGLIKEMDDDNARMFANAYRAKRKDPQLILLTALLGFIVVAGVHRFILGQIGMGLLYLFTGGLCLIGTIVDLVNHQKLAFESNQKVAQEVLTMIR